MPRLDSTETGAPLCQVTIEDNVQPCVSRFPDRKGNSQTTFALNI